MRHRTPGFVDIIRVRQLAGTPRRAAILAGGLLIPCAIGPAGMTRRKREGDGATPIGRFHLLLGLYRPDRIRRPNTHLPLRALRRNDGWCDDLASSLYNRPVRLPFSSGHERMWRDDNVYDVVIVLDHNRSPRVRGCGSAIFFHLARPDGAPTAGCVAIAVGAMRRLLTRLTPRTRMVIG